MRFLGRHQDHLSSSQEEGLPRDGDLRFSIDDIDESALEIGTRYNLGRNLPVFFI
jgi:hypothetical protein